MGEGGVLSGQDVLGDPISLFLVQVSPGVRPLSQIRGA
jgi:hypothetical protein